MVNPRSQRSIDLYDFTEKRGLSTFPGTLTCISVTHLISVLLCINFRIASLLQEVSTQTMLVTWPQAVKDVQTVPLFISIKRQEHKPKIASRVLKVTQQKCTSWHSILYQFKNDHIPKKLKTFSNETNSRQQQWERDVASTSLNAFIKYVSTHSL